MKKILCLACALLICSAFTAFAACTGEDFQKEVMSMKTTMSAFGQDADKMAKVAAAMEQYNQELGEFAELVQSASADPQKVQAMLDRGCDLYSKINKTLAELK
jgi:hypothetical protein